MGEPFRGQVGGTPPVYDWIAIADRDHDGAVSKEEMVADGARFFAKLDLNKDGVIDFDEIGHYETVVAPARLRFDGGLRPVVSRDKDDDSGNGREMYGDRRRGQSRDARVDLAYLEVPEPVLMTDADFDRRVTPQEFAKAAADRFAEADKNRDGRLDQVELDPAPLKGKEPNRQKRP